MSTNKSSRTTWKIAAGNCGFNTDGAVHAAYVNEHALFAFQSRISSKTTPVFLCIVVGRTAVTGRNLDEVKAAGVQFAKNYKQLSPDREKRGMTVKEFSALVNRVDVALPKAA